MPLSIVPKSAPTETQKVVLRIKAMPRPDGALACPRCGGMTVLTTSSGDAIVKGRYQRGSVVDDRVCAECWKRGIFSPMMPPRIEVAKP